MNAPSSSRSSSEERPVPSPQRREMNRGEPLAHLILNGCLALLFTALFLQAGNLPSSMWEPLGSGSFPRLVLAILVVINLAIMVKELRRFRALPAGKPGMVSEWIKRHRLAFGVLALLAVYILCVPWLGFALASLGFVLAGQWLLGARTPRSLAIALVIALCFSFGIDLLFREVFVISLPRGLLG
ncbi:tripartite tricarboxylate transporter TctB family protein [Halomonas huangheensis]|nr:tripartite tricarboxylate transporter TctB family protein [Halomonas huangheensis]